MLVDGRCTSPTPAQLTGLSSTPELDQRVKGTARPSAWLSCSSGSWFRPAVVKFCDDDLVSARGKTGPAKRSRGGGVQTTRRKANVTRPDFSTNLAGLVWFCSIRHRLSRHWRHACRIASYKRPSSRASRRWGDEERFVSPASRTFERVFLTACADRFDADQL